MRSESLMSILAIVVSLLITASLHATDYYIDATGGLDTNVGTSEAASWQTITHVNTQTFLPGDRILFKRGEIWRDSTLYVSSGDATNWITYGAYGIGNKPQIRRSMAANSTTQWLDQGNNIWELDATFPVNSDVAFMSLNHDAEIARKVWAEADLTEQNEFWTDEANSNRTKMYSVGNPATFYNNIEVVIHEEGIRALDNTAYVLIENIHVRYAGWSGIEMSDLSHHITVQDCDISYIGGGKQNSSTSTRNGNGINTQRSANNIEITRCKIWQCYDAGIALQGWYTPGLVIDNIYIHHNNISNCENSIEFWGGESDSALSNIFIENNSCFYAGYGWSHSQRPVLDGSHIKAWTFIGTTSNINIRNNVFYEAQEDLVHINTRSTTHPGITFDYNDYYKTTGDEPQALTWGYWGVFTYYNLTEFSSWQTDTGWDASGIPVAPQLVDIPNGNYRPAINSNIIDLGANTSYAWDITQTYLYRGVTYDMGAYESVLWKYSDNLLLDHFAWRLPLVDDYNSSFWASVNTTANVSEILEDQGFLRIHQFGDTATSNAQAFIRTNVESNLDFFNQPITLHLSNLSIDTTNLTNSDAYAWILLTSDAKDYFNTDDAICLEIKGDLTYSLKKKVNLSSSSAYTILESGTLTSLPVDITLSLDGQYYALTLSNGTEIHQHSGRHNITATDWVSTGASLFFQTKRQATSGDMLTKIDRLSVTNSFVDEFENNSPSDSDTYLNFWTVYGNTATRWVGESNGQLTFDHTDSDLDNNRIQTDLLPDLNFFNSPVAITIDDIQMSGTAAQNSRRMFITLTSEVKTSYAADDKFRLDLYADGNVYLYLQTDGAGIGTPIASGLLSAAPASVVIQIDKTRYDVVITDTSNNTVTLSGIHGINISNWGPPATQVTGDVSLQIETKKTDSLATTAQFTIDHMTLSRDFK